jgi:nucleoside-diphosphate-sugar epimerase
MFMTTEQGTAVLGATGPVGYQVVSTLMQTGMPVLAVSRSGNKLAALQKANPGVGVTALDLTKEKSRLAEIARSHKTFVVTAGVAPANLNLQIEMVRNVIAAGPKRLMYVSSCWSYMPLSSIVVDENHPRAATGAIRHRAEAEDAVVDAGGTVLHVPDFYGPGVHTSPLQRVIATAMRGRRVTWPTGREVVREHVYMGDLGQIIARSVEAAPTGHFIVPGSGPISFADMIDYLSTILHRRVPSTSLGRVPTPVLRLLDPWSRQLGDALDEYRKPVTYNASLLESFIGKTAATPYRDGITSTVEWARQARAGA